MNINQWDIYLVNFNPVINILPLTTKKENRVIYPNEVLLRKSETKLKDDSLLFQIKTIDKRRLIKKLDSISKSKIKESIFHSLLFQIGFYK